jgi:LPS-assembly protein
MRTLSILVMLFLIVWVAYLPAASGATLGTQQITRGGGPLEIEADELSFEKEAQRYEGHGRVEITRGDLSLKADHARLNMVTRDVMAWGNVVLREGEDVLECERLEVNLDTRLGKVHRATIFVKDQNVHITGQEVDKLGENHYRLRDSTLTTCDGEHPPWKISAKELEMTMGGMGYSKGAVFHIEDFPVLYLPWAVFPVRLERQTGFLLPNVGNSGEFGPEVRTAFYWAMAKNMDATFYLDRLGDHRGRGWQEGLEYRYAFAKETKGQASAHFIDDQVYGENRYSGFSKHQQKLPYDVYLKSDLNYVSDNDYPRDFDENLPDRTGIDSRSLQQVRSVAFGGKNWERFSFLAEGMAFQDLTQTSNDETVQKLPQVSFFAQPQTFLGSPFFFDLSSSYVNFWREQGTKAHRIDLFPRLSYPLRVLDVLKLKSEAGLRETLYRPYDDPSDEQNEWESREIPEATVQLSTEFYRVVNASPSSWISNLFNVARWMHTVEPWVAYQYSDRVDQDELPLFDDIDRISYTNAIAYGFTQRLIGKPVRERVESGPQEYGKLKIFQSYSFGDPYDRDRNGRGRYFSDVFAELWWRFNPYLSAYADIGVSPYDGEVNRVDGVITLRDRRNDALHVEYHRTKNKLNPQNDIEAINLIGRVKTINPLYLHGSIRYNLQDSTWIEKIVGLEYQAQCWVLGVVVEEKGSTTTSTNSSERTAKVYLTLLGLGSVGNRPSPMSF